MRCRASLVLLRSIGMAKKKRAVPKATSASKSAGGAIVSSPAASSGSQPAAGVAAAPSAEESGKRRRLFKRDSEERVQRIIDRKFANIDAVIIDSRRNKAGQTLRDVIAQALRDLTPRRTYLPLLSGPSCLTTSTCTRPLSSNCRQSAIISPLPTTCLKL